jgi:ornithine cyclodeaminase
MRVINAAEVHANLPFDGLIEALRRAHLGSMPKHGSRLAFEEPNPDAQPDRFIIIPAWQPGEGILAKFTTSFPKNKERHGLPTVNSVYAFIDGATGVTEAVIDGEAMIFRKTAADSALGASLLARDDAETMLMVGAGALAPYLVAAHRTARPSIRRVLVWNRTAAAGEGLAAKLRAAGVDATAVDDLGAALERADLVSSATMATSPIILGARLKPGAHVDLVGSFTPEMRESDDEVLRRSAIYVDHRQCTERSGEFLDPFARGVISPADVRGDLFELCQGKVARRTSPEQVTMMKNGGGSHLDYYATNYLMDRLAGRF